MNRSHHASWLLLAKKDVLGLVDLGSNEAAATCTITEQGQGPIR